MMHICIMVKIGEVKNINKAIERKEGGVFIFCRNRGNLYFFGNRENLMCIIDLRGMDAPAYTATLIIIRLLIKLSIKVYINFIDWAHCGSLQRPAKRGLHMFMLLNFSLV